MTQGRLGRYEILERVGNGGMGVVFRARDPLLGREVALKVLAEEFAGDAEFRHRLVREARAEARLSHPNIATCFDVGEAAPEPADLLAPGTAGPHPARLPYLAMEFVEGEDLQRVLQARVLRVDEAVAIALQVADGLECAHAAGIVHRDLKSGNVRLRPDGVAKILDFGLAQVRAETARAAGETAPSFHTSRSRILGTPAFMSPEQAEGRAGLDARSDLFSFGVLLYHMVTGRLPFEGRTAMETMFNVVNAEPQPLARFAAGVPAELERITSKLLAKRPDDRYQSAHEAATDLRRLRDALATPPRGTPPGPRRPPGGASAWPTWARDPRRWTRGRRLALALLAVAALAALAGTVARRRPAPGAAAGHANGVAVLAFDNRTGDPAWDAASAGFRADLLAEFVQRTDLVVVLPEAGAEAPGREPHEVARELGVRALLQGELRREAERQHLRVWLVEAATRRVRWASGYDFTLAEAGHIRGDIVARVVQRMTARLLAAGEAPAPAWPRTADAYEAYLEGVEALTEPDDPLARERARDAFERASDLDPGSALAWAGRARALWWLYDREHDPDLLRRADSCAAEALRLAPGLVTARVVRARLLRLTGRTDEALREAEEARRLNPGYEDAAVELSNIHRKRGEYEQAIALARDLTRLRPGYWKHWEFLGTTLLRHGDADGARAAFEHAIGLAPSVNRPRESLAALQMIQGDPAGALATYARLPQPVTDASLASNIGTAAFFSHRYEDARRQYLLAVSLEPRDPGLRMNLGDSYVALGRGPEARVQYLEAARYGEEALAAEADSPRLRSQLALYLAKAGECARVRDMLRADADRAPQGDIEVMRDRAKALALCGGRAEALAVIRHVVVELRAPGKLFGDEPEFAALRGDPEFEALVGRRAR